MLLVKPWQMLMRKPLVTPFHLQTPREITLAILKRWEAFRQAYAESFSAIIDALQI
jgi:hypothetical protein